MNAYTHDEPVFKFHSAPTSFQMIGDGGPPWARMSPTGEVEVLDIARARELATEAGAGGLGGFVAALVVHAFDAGRTSGLDSAVEVCEGSPERKQADGVYVADQQACVEAIKRLKGIPRGEG